ncbi:MAG: histidine kinase [Dehalococcoidales bacterium]|jgi:PAS domain S-box-containing protein|nr:histidine kinase [Dehalococcoidales bacterium]
MSRAESSEKNLRRRAEKELLQKETAGLSFHSNDIDCERLIHELQVHQIELEIQKEELIRSQKELQESRQHFYDLYELAPVGYFTIDKNYQIIEVNLTGSLLLKIERSKLRRIHFTRFIIPEETDRFYFYFREILSNGVKRALEMKMQKADKTRFFARLESLRASDSKVLLALIDITEQKLAEDELRKAKAELESKVRERTIELEHLNDHLKQYGRKITQVQEEERKRIAYELHDDTAQYLSILKLQLDALLQSGKIKDPEIVEKLYYLQKDADRAFQDVRRYSHELRPGVLDHLGLRAALEQAVEDINGLKQIKIDFNVEGSEPVLSDEVKLSFFRIAQEALNNIRKHAKTDKATVHLQFKDCCLKMVISDKGSGFDVRLAEAQIAKKGNLGILSMQERARLAGAKLKIESAPGQGTAVIVEANMNT